MSSPLRLVLIIDVTAAHDPIILQERVRRHPLSLRDRIAKFFHRRPGLKTASVRNLCQALKDRAGTVNADTIREAVASLVADGHGKMDDDGHFRIAV